MITPTKGLEKFSEMRAKVLSNNGLKQFVDFLDNIDPSRTIFGNSCDWDENPFTLKLPLTQAALDNCREIHSTQDQPNVRMYNEPLLNGDNQFVGELLFEISIEPFNTSGHNYYSDYALSRGLVNNKDKVEEFIQIMNIAYPVELDDTKIGSSFSAPLLGITCIELSQNLALRDQLLSEKPLLYKLCNVASLSIPFSCVKPNLLEEVQTRCAEFCETKSEELIVSTTGRKAIMSIQLPVEAYEELKSFAQDLGLAIEAAD